MTTQITTQQRVRDDLADEATKPLGRAWALSGVAAGVAGFAMTILSGMVDAVYREGVVDDPSAVIDRMDDKVPEMIAFHVLATLAALLLVPFGLGLFRRLRATLGPDSLVPGIAAFGVLGTTLVVLVGTVLDTEFIFAVTESDMVLPESAAMYNHWIGTVPWVWSLTGLTGWALFSAKRAGAVRGWIGIVGLVLGTLSLLLTFVPLQYMSAWTGAVMLVLVGLGLAFGDRRTR